MWLLNYPKFLKHSLGGILFGLLTNNDEYDEQQYHLINVLLEGINNLITD